MRNRDNHASDAYLQDVEYERAHGADSGKGNFDSSIHLNKTSVNTKSVMSGIITKPAGDRVRLKCITDGNSYPNITWLKNGAPIERSDIVFKNNRGTIVLDDLSTNDGGNYTCIACNPEGCINHITQLVVGGK